MKRWMLATMALAAGLSAGSIGAVETPPPSDEPVNEAPARVRERLRGVFEARLREELKLTDEQVGIVVPKLAALEDRRREMRRERMTLIRGMRRALRDGSDDATIERMLETLDRLGIEQEEATRRTLRDVDEALSARQRVELRFFVARFRGELGERLRGTPPPGRGRRR